MAATALALVAANSPAVGLYNAFLDAPVRRVIPFGDHRVHSSSQFFERRVSLRADKTLNQYNSGITTASSAVKRI
jgi:hypothetical protein